MTTHIPISKIHKTLKTEDFALVIAKRKYLTIMSVRCVCSIINKLEEINSQHYGKEVSEIYVFGKTDLGKQAIKNFCVDF